MFLAPGSVAVLWPNLSHTSIPPALLSSPPRLPSLCISWKWGFCHCNISNRSGSHLQGSVSDYHLDWIRTCSPRKAHSLCFFLETKMQPEDPTFAHPDFFLSLGEDNVVSHHWTASLPSSAMSGMSTGFRGGTASVPGRWKGSEGDQESGKVWWEGTVYNAHHKMTLKPISCSVSPLWDRYQAICPHLKGVT